MLETAAQRLGALAEPAPRPVLAVSDVLRQCRRFLGFKVDTTAALAWIRERALQQAQAVIRSEIGPRAAELARKCEQQAQIVAALQQAIQQEAQHLAEGPRGSWQPPDDSWLLEPADIAAAIEANVESVTDAVVAAVCEGLADELLTLSDGTSANLRAFFENRFKEEAIRAMEREAVRLTRRPPDTLKRVQRRVDMCEPMAQITDSGPEFLRIMGSQQPSAPLRLVLTALDGEDRERLQDWATQQAMGSGDQHAFQIAKSDDPLRDDALYLSFGWPLWLFNEVKQCQMAVDRAAELNPQLTGFARTILEIDDAASHELTPMAATDTERLFSYAVVLRHIQPVRENRVLFEDGLFGSVPEAPSMEQARARFSRFGMNRFMKRHLDSMETQSGFIATVTEHVERRRSELPGAPPGLKASIEKAIALVEADLQRYMGL